MEDALTRGISHIYRALLKNGHSNFSVTILEYCEVADLLIREKHYWDIFTPEYNIAKEPGAPMSGRKHSDDTKKIISDAMTGENHPMFGQNHTDASKKIMSDVHQKIDNPGRFKPGENHPNYGKSRFEGSGRPSQAIEVTDIKNNQTTTYDSINAAAKALNITPSSTITNYILRNQKKPYKGKYTFKKI